MTSFYLQKTTEAASSFRVSPRYFRRLAAQYGIQPVHKSGRTSLWAASDLTLLVEHMKQNQSLTSSGVPTVSRMIDFYRSSSRFDSLSPASKQSYSYDLERFRVAFGAKSVAMVKRADAVRYYEEIRHKPRSAAHIIKCARLVFNLAKDMGYITLNPFERLRVKSNPPRDLFWTEEDLSSFIQSALKIGRYSMALAVRLGADMGQRTGDIRLLKRNSIIENAIFLKQGKTKIPVKIPLLKSSLDLLNSHPFPQSEYLVSSEQTLTCYDKYNFNKWFSIIRKNAKIRKELQFKDLRTTAVLNLTLAGCTVQEVAAITGHKIDRCQKIIDHYLPRNEKVAANAISRYQNYIDNQEKNSL
jgi:hypothetical protein